MIRSNSVIHQSIIIGILINMVSLVAYGQQDWEKPAGDIEDAKVVIEKDKVIKLPAVARRFESIPPELPVKKKKDLKYQIPPISATLTPVPVRLRPRKMQNEPLKKLYNGMGMLGYGNFNSLYMMADYGTKRSDEYAFHARFSHFLSSKGPIQGKKSGAGNTSARMDGRVFLNKSTLSGILDYHRTSFHYYGLEPIALQAVDKSIIKQYFNNYSAKIAISSNEAKQPVDYQVKARVNYLSDRFALSENIVGLTSHVNTRLSDDWKIDVLANFSSIRQKDLTIGSINRRYLALRPMIAYQWFDILFKGGIGFYNENDPISTSSTHIYPDVSATYTGIEHLTIQFTLNGEMEEVTLAGMVKKTTYLASHVDVNHNLRPLGAKLKLEGDINSRMSYGLSYSYDAYDRIGYYLNTPADTSRLNLVYDLGNTSIGHLMAGWRLKWSDLFSLNLNGSYFTYQTSDLPEAWHRPKYKIELEASFHPLEALWIDASLTLIGGIKALDGAGSVRKLGTITDLNLAGHYSLTDRAGVFIKLFNITGDNYQLIKNYPVKGFQVVGGISYTF